MRNIFKIISGLWAFLTLYLKTGSLIPTVPVRLPVDYARTVIALQVGKPLWKSLSWQFWADPGNQRVLESCIKQGWLVPKSKYVKGAGPAPLVSPDSVMPHYLAVSKPFCVHENKEKERKAESPYKMSFTYAAPLTKTDITLLHGCVWGFPTPAKIPTQKQLARMLAAVKRSNEALTKKAEKANAVPANS